MYLRISSEDEDLRTGEKDESESISNQRSLLRDYVYAAMQIYPALKYWNFVTTVGAVRISSVQL